MKIFSNDNLLLKKLTIEDSESFYNIYANSKVTKNFEESPFLSREIPEEFTKRIIDSCDFIWTIRFKENPNLIIGDSAFHHFDMINKSIEIGGSLLPEYWGKNIMKQVFELMIEFAKESLDIKEIIGKTKTNNKQAIKMIEKLGFVVSNINGDETILKKLLYTE